MNVLSEALFQQYCSMLMKQQRLFTLVGTGEKHVGGINVFFIVNMTYEQIFNNILTAKYFMQLLPTVNKLHIFTLVYCIVFSIYSYN